MAVCRSCVAVATAVALLGASGCTTHPQTGRQEISKAGAGAVTGATAGTGALALIGGRQNRARMMLGAGIGALADGAIGGYMDRQERELRARTAGTDVKVTRQGADVMLTMPAGTTFATDSYEIQPRFRRTLDGIAGTLAHYRQTYIDVYGHTDSTGTDAINQPLSESRAAAVADYLEGKGVQPARVGTRGFGASQPVTSNDTQEGRQANRRVEIRIVPVTDPNA